MLQKKIWSTRNTIWMRKKILPRGFFFHSSLHLGRLTQRLECHLHTVEVRSSNLRPPTTTLSSRSPADPGSFFFKGFTRRTTPWKSYSISLKFRRIPGPSPGSAQRPQPLFISFIPWGSAWRTAISSGPGWTTGPMSISRSGRPGKIFCKSEPRSNGSCFPAPGKGVDCIVSGFLYRT